MDALIPGIWSSEAPYGRLAMSDYLLIFLPDHTGYFEEINVGTYAYEMISWSVVRNGTLSIMATSRRIKEGGVEVSVPGYILMPRVPYSINHELAPTGEIMDILRITLPQEPPWPGFPDTFGRTHTLGDLIKYPRAPKLD